MALPIYQPTGYLPSDIPRLDRADVKETANQLTTITSALDRVSQFAFKKAEEQAQREGLLYGAENTPSTEQVLAAQKEGKSIQELFAEPGTTFGDAARKVQAAQLRNQLEVQGRNKLAELSVAIDSGSFNLQEVQQEITSITNGYAKSIASVSPEESLRFRASMGTAGNAVYNKAATNAGKIYQEGIKFSTDEMLSQTPIILMDSITSSQDAVMLGERFKVEASRVYDIAKQTGDAAFVKNKMDEFNAAKMKAIVDYSITPEFAKTPAEGIRKIMVGDYGKLDVVMQTVDRNKLIKMYVDRQGEVATAWNRTNELNAAVNQDRVNEIKDQMYTGAISGSTALSRVKALGVTLPDAERKSMLNGDNAGANTMMYGMFESLADRQLVGESYFDELATNKVISWKQANALKKNVRNDEPTMSQARGLIRNSLGVPDMMSPGFGQEKQAVARLNTELQTRQATARANGEPFNAYQVAQELVAGKEAQLVIEGQKAKQARIAKKFDTYNIVYDSSRTYTPEDLKRMGIKDIDAKTIIRIQNGR